jgi:hypothetical protein
MQRTACRACKLSATYWVLPGSTDLDVWRSPLLDRMAVQYLTADPESEIPGSVEEIVRGAEEHPLPTAEEPHLVVPVPGGPLRGIRLDFRSGPAELSAGDLVAEVRDSGGELLTSTRRLVQFARPAVPLYVPLLGEDFPAGNDLTVELYWDGPTAPPVVAMDAEGRPSLDLIRPADDGLRLVVAEGAEVWERTTVIPRIHWADATSVIEVPEDRLAALASGKVPADTVVLDEPGEPAEGRPADVEVLEDSGDRIRARVDADGAGYLVVSESVQSDWTATVDGEKADIVPADHAFGAIHVPAGSHEISLSYTPRGGTAGLVATGTGLVALALMALAPALRRRRDEVEPAEGTAVERSAEPAPVG